MTDTELITGLSQHQQAAVDYLYQRYKPYIMQLLLAKKISVAEAEDIFQDAVVAELQKRPEQPLELHTATYKTYFRAICLNLYRSWCRKHDRLANVSPDELTLPGNETTIEQELNQHEFRRIIDRGLTSLGQECRSIVRGQLISKIPLEELAKKMGISYANMRKKASRCRKKLRQLIQADPFYLELTAL